MQTAFTFYGVVHEASAGRIVIGNGYATTVYEGAFAYDVHGGLSGGTLAAVTHSTQNAARPGLRRHGLVGGRRDRGRFHQPRRPPIAAPGRAARR
jgi:hypothetical protein